MLKKLIAPLQKIILQKRYCPGCTRSLTRAKLIAENHEEKLVVCKCKRVFVHELELDTFRRAVAEDIKNIK
jgi:hypothetical protein